MKKKFLVPFYLLGFLGVLLIVFKAWFLPGVITGGDLPYYYPQLIKSVPLLSSWDIRDMGMGSSMLPTLWLQLYTTTTLRLFSFFPWDIYVRISWLFPYLVISMLTSFLLGCFYFKNGFFRFLTPFLFICNTYGLLLVGGGQMGIALSYAVAPLAVWAFEKFLKKATLRSTVFLSFIFSLCLLLDIRIGYILVWLFGLRFLFELFPLTKEKVKHYLFFLPTLCAIVIGLHMFWLLPTFLTHASSLKQFGDIYTSTNAVAFFSFAKFENALGLLHPNWPENLFGLTHFMKPEFLFIPLLAFSSLLFISENKREKLTILFLCLLAILGVFLAKGANDPFGQIYLWMFTHIPGFIMFRDPTKWYLFVVISYSLLIPYTVEKIYILMKERFFLIASKIFSIQNLFIVCVIYYLLFLIKPAVFGQLSGTLRQRQVPSDYIKLEQFLLNQKRFSRTMWMPQVQRFGFSSYTHPAVSVEDFSQTTTLVAAMDFLSSPKTEKLLQDGAVAYVIVPFDSEKEIFLKDRKYNDSLSAQTLRQIRAISWLREIPGFGKVHVFALGNAKDHFWLSGQGDIAYAFISPTQYVVHLFHVEKGERMIFSENYDSFWTVEADKKIDRTKLFDTRLNSFALPKSGSYTITVFYEPQKWVMIGSWISVIVFLFTIMVVSSTKT